VSVATIANVPAQRLMVAPRVLIVLLGQPLPMFTFRHRAGTAKTRIA